MKSKFEKFNKLLPEVKIETAQRLSNSDLVRLAQSSKHYLALFKPVIDARKLLYLLYCVTRGEHGGVNAILKQDINLIFKRGEVTDCSGREFENISGFEYALWALDKHMWTAMIECITGHKENKEVFAQLIAQYNKINTVGVTYRLDGKLITEKHFDFKNTLIKELQTQVDLINAPGIKDWDAINKQWLEGVGGAQKMIPVHIVYEYCSKESFGSVPMFASQPESSKEFFDFDDNNKKNWFDVISGLSVNFAIYKGSCLQAFADKSDYDGVKRDADLDAMVALCKVREDDFIDLGAQLGNLMTRDSIITKNNFG